MAVGGVAQVFASTSAVEGMAQALTQNTVGKEAKEAKVGRLTTRITQLQIPSRSDTARTKSTKYPSQYEYRFGSGQIE